MSCVLLKLTIYSLSNHYSNNFLEERKLKTPNPSEFKAKYYKIHNNYKLFIESDDWQAQEIYKISGKPVYCVGTNKLYQ